MPPGAQKEDPPVPDQGEKREGPYATSLPDTNKPSSTNPTPNNPTILNQHGVLQTLLDSARELTRDELERVLDDALMAGQTTITEVAKRVRGAVGSPHVRDLRAIIQERTPTRSPINAANGGITRSRAEQHIKRLVLAFDDIPAPQFNYRIRLANGESIELDVAWPEFRVGLDVDGYRWHGGRKPWKRDLQRDNQITLAGWNVEHIIPEITPSELHALITALLNLAPG